MCIKNLKPSPFTKPKVFYKNFEAEGYGDNLRLFDWNSGRTEYHEPYMWDPAYEPNGNWPQKGFCAWVSKKSAERMNCQQLRPLGRPIWARIRVLPEDILGIGTAPWANNRKAVMVRAFEILDFEDERANRLHPDYKGKPGFVEYPIEYDSHGDSFVSIPRGTARKEKFYNPSQHKKFIGFVSPDGEIMNNMVMFYWSPNKNTPARLHSYVPALFVDTENYTVVTAQTVRFEK